MGAKACSIGVTAGEEGVGVRALREGHVRPVVSTGPTDLKASGRLRLAPPTADKLTDTLAQLLTASHPPSLTDRQSNV